MTDTDGDLSISSKIVIVNQKFISSLTIPKLSPTVDKCLVPQYWTEADQTNIMMEISKPEIRSIRISADQKSILKKTFEKFPHPSHSAEALDLLSLKTGLRPEMIRKWFQKRRIALNKKNDDDEIQILDDNCEINSTNTGELENYDEDYIDLDNDDSSETSSATGAVSSTS